MRENTPNHGLHTYEPGDTDWTHSPDMETIEERLVVRAPEADRDEYEPHADATFVATDSGAVYDGDGSQWVSAARRLETIRAEDATAEDVAATECLAVPTYDDRASMATAIDGDGTYLGVVDGELEVLDTTSES